MNEILYWYDKITRERIWHQNDSFALMVKMGPTWLESLIFGIEDTGMNSVSGNIVEKCMR